MTDTITREMTRDQIAAALRAHDGYPGFLGSLAFKLGEYGRLSDKQWDAAGRILGERATRTAPAEVGVYRKDGSLYVVREFTPAGESRKVRYCRQIVALTDAQGDRLSEAGERIRTEERKAPGMQHRLTAGDRLPLAEVEALSVRFSYCLVCGRALRVAASVERGIGPVCRGRQGG